MYTDKCQHLYIYILCYFIYNTYLKKDLTRHPSYDIISYVADALLAQLDRVTGYEPVGQGFESLAAHH